MPDFRAILGYGIIHHFMDKWEAEDGTWQAFLIGWKIMSDGQVNRTLARVSPGHSLPLEMVIVQIEDDEAACPVFMKVDRKKAYVSIRQ